MFSKNRHVEARDSQTGCARASTAYAESEPANSAGQRKTVSGEHCESGSVNVHTTSSFLLSCDVGRSQERKERRGTRNEGDEKETRG